jgi:NADH-quinone oxidoreductase subunit J
MSDCLFYVFAALAAASALFMVSARSAVNSAMGMILALVAVAADYFLLDAPFLGVLQVLVYAGAVMVLFLFIIMLLDVDKASHAKRPVAKWAAGVAVTHGGITNHAATPTPAAPLADGIDAPLPHGTTAKEFGYGLFTKYMLPLQIAGFLLLSAMIGVVTLSKRPKDAA